MEYNFNWNPEKEQININKHKIDFRKAATVFNDRFQLSIYDETHSYEEDRWITIGIDSDGILRVVIHTFEQKNQFTCNIRIISARKATNKETKQYQVRNI